MAEAATGGAKMLLEGLTDEEKLALLQSLPRQFSDERSMLEGDMARSQALMDTPMPEGRTAGGMYHAANPLEFLGAGLRQYQGGKGVTAAQGGLGKLREDEERQKSLVLAQMLRGLG